MLFCCIQTIEINAFFHEIFWQQQEHSDHTKKPIWCWQIMILLFDMIMTKASEFNQDGLYILPIYVTLSLPMATKAGFAAFRDDKVSISKKKVFIVFQSVNPSKIEGGDKLSIRNKEYLINYSLQ